MLGMVTIVTLPDRKVRMKIIGSSSKLQHFDLATKLLALQQVPNLHVVQEFAKETGFGEGGTIVIRLSALPDDQFDRADFNPELESKQMGYTNVVYVRSTD